MPAIQTPLLVSCNLFLLVAIMLLMRSAKRYPYRVNVSYRRQSILLSVVFVLFAFWGADWFHYQDVYAGLRNGESGHIEHVYMIVAQKLSIGYISFRMMIWGTGLLMYCLLIRRLPVNPDAALMFFLSIWLIWFSYARVSVAMAMVFLGASLLYRPSGHRLLSYVLGLILMASSVFFHKTAIFALLVVAVSMMAGLLDRKVFAVAVPILFIAGRYLMPSVLAGFMAMDGYGDGMMSGSLAYGQKYMEGEAAESGLGSWLQRLLEMLPYYLLAISSYVVLLKHDVEKDIAVNMRMIIMIVMTSSLLLFDYGVNTSVMYVRFMRFSFIPSSIVLAYLWCNGILKGMTGYTYLIALAGTFYSVIYSLYCTIVIT